MKKVEPMYQAIAEAIFEHLGDFDRDDNTILWDEFNFQSKVLFVSGRIRSSSGCEYQSEPDLDIVKIIRPERESGVDDVELKAYELVEVEKALYNLLAENFEVSKPFTPRSKRINSYL